MFGRVATHLALLRMLTEFEYLPCRCSASRAGGHRSRLLVFVPVLAIHILSPGRRRCGTSRSCRREWPSLPDRSSNSGIHRACTSCGCTPADATRPSHLESS
eukprot:9275630-Pyramimonas_sp.AAC.1